MLVDDAACTYIREKLLWIALYSPIARQLVVKDHHPYIAAAVVNPLLNNESFCSTILHSPELFKISFQLLQIKDFENHLTFAAVISLQNKGKREWKTSPLKWKSLEVVIHAAKEKGFRMWNPHGAEE
jgi:hypothetical protein